MLQNMYLVAKMLQNEHLVAKIGVDTAENEPLQIWMNIQFTIQFPPYSGRNSKDHFWTPVEARLNVRIDPFVVKAARTEINDLASFYVQGHTAKKNTDTKKTLQEPPTSDAFRTTKFEVRNSKRRKMESRKLNYIGTLHFQYTACSKFLSAGCLLHRKMRSGP